MNIREYLKKYGLTQQQFAEKIGVKQPTICRIMNGKNRPHAIAAEKIEAATNGEVTKEEAIWGNEANLIQEKNEL